MEQIINYNQKYNVHINTVWVLINLGKWLHVTIGFKQKGHWANVVDFYFLQIGLFSNLSSISMCQMYNIFLELLNCHSSDTHSFYT